MDTERPPKITDEQRRALNQQPGPVYVIDVDSNHQYVLMPADDYRHFRALFESDQFDITETYTAQAQALEQVWTNSELDEYGSAGVA